jgi:steroid 5-alpha reductase family enzyme
MFELHTFFTAALLGLAATAALAIVVWLASLVVHDVSIVDSAWSLLVLATLLAGAAALPDTGPRSTALIVLATLWALRLSGYIAWRHRGQPEDRRYQAIRSRNQPHFEWKSLYLVFGLQALLAWIVAAPLLAGIASRAPWHLLDAAGLLLAAAGLAFEAVADAQLARFKADPANRGRVMASGLWRYSRHPNYFGECCVWWGFWLLALAAGAWWTVVSPLLMTLLLLKVSGVSLLEKDIGERRPAYRDYIRQTNAFIPGRPHA